MFFRCVCVKNGYSGYLMASLIKPQLVGLTSVEYAIPKCEWPGFISELILLMGFISNLEASCLGNWRTGVSVKCLLFMLHCLSYHM